MRCSDRKFRNQGNAREWSDEAEDIEIQHTSGASCISISRAAPVLALSVLELPNGAMVFAPVGKEVPSRRWSEYASASQVISGIHTVHVYWVTPCEAPAVSGISSAVHLSPLIPLLIARSLSLQIQKTTDSAKWKITHSKARTLLSHP